jgi:hypothetical protein
MRPVTGCHCRYCKLHGKGKTHSWKAMRRLTKKALRNGTEPPKTVSCGYSSFSTVSDAPAQYLV